MWLFELLKAKICYTTTMNALTKKKKKKPRQPSIKKKKIVFVFVGRWLHLNVFRNNNFVQVVKNKIKYFIKIIFFPSIKKLKFSLFFIILMSCLCYFKWSDKKKKTFDIGCIVKWGGKIENVTFWVIKS